jgi:hypothetical protein
MKDMKTELGLADDEHWPFVSMVTVSGDLTAAAMPIGVNQVEGEKTVQTWQKVAVLKVAPVSEVYFGFMAGDHAQFMNVPVKLQNGCFGTRVGQGDVKFFCVPKDLTMRVRLMLVKVTRTDDPEYSDLPLY